MSAATLASKSFPLSMNLNARQAHLLIEAVSVFLEYKIQNEGDKCIPQADCDVINALCMQLEQHAAVCEKAGDTSLREYVEKRLAGFNVAMG